MRPLKDLKILRLDEVQISKYVAFPDHLKKLKGVSKTAQYYYALYRPYLLAEIGKRKDSSEILKDSFEDELPYNIEAVDAEIDENTEALLCSTCFDLTSRRKSKIPKLSLKNNVDFGLAWMYLPELSVLGKLCQYNLYHHVFKLGATSAIGNYAMRGHMIAMETNAFSIMKENVEDYANKSTLIIPHPEFTFEIMFCGYLDKWEKINATLGSRNEFIKLYKKQLHVNGNELLIWINFLKHSYPERDIQINQEYINQDNINNMIHNSIKDAKTYPVDSKENNMDDFVRKNVPGADIAESLTEDDSAVQYSFVSEDKSFDIERTVEEREHFLSSTFKQLFDDPFNNINKVINENEDTEEKDDPNKDANISIDGANKRGNEVCIIFIFLFIFLGGSVRV